MPAFIYAVLLLMNIHIVKLRTIIISIRIQNPRAINTTVNQINRLKISGSLYKHVESSRFQSIICHHYSCFLSMLSCNQRKQGIPPYEPREKEVYDGTRCWLHDLRPQDAAQEDAWSGRELGQGECWSLWAQRGRQHLEHQRVWRLPERRQGMAWGHTVYACRQDAEDAIGRMDKGFYDDHAVLYYDVDSLKPTAVMNNIKTRHDETMMKRETLIASSRDWAGRKSKYVSCEHCGSKLNIERRRSIFTYTCPLCRNDLRSETVRNRIKAYDENIKELRGKYVKEMKKLKSKAAVKWLVKMEVHCWNIYVDRGGWEPEMVWFPPFFVVSLVRPPRKCRPTGSCARSSRPEKPHHHPSMQSVLSFPNHADPSIVPALAWFMPSC